MAMIRQVQITFDCADPERVTTSRVEERLAALEAECDTADLARYRRGQPPRADDENESCQVRQDIEGNEFCLD